MTEADDKKAEHKASAASANDNKAYEETAFGRRRISWMPKWLAAIMRLVGKPISFICHSPTNSSQSNPDRARK